MKITRRSRKFNHIQSESLELRSMLSATTGIIAKVDVDSEALKLNAQKVNLLVDADSDQRASAVDKTQEPTTNTEQIEDPTDARQEAISDDFEADRKRRMFEQDGKLTFEEMKALEALKNKDAEPPEDGSVAPAPEPAPEPEPEDDVDEDDEDEVCECDEDDDTDITYEVNDDTNNGSGTDVGEGDLSLPAEPSVTDPAEPSAGDDGTPIDGFGDLGRGDIDFGEDHVEYVGQIDAAILDAVFAGINGAIDPLPLVD